MGKERIKTRQQRQKGNQELELEEIRQQGEKGISCDGRGTSVSGEQRRLTGKQAIETIMIIRQWG